MATTRSATKEESFARRIVWPRPFVGLRGLAPAGWPVEILAGLTLAALVIPLNIGYADVAGLPPHVGLYAGILPMVAYALFATSRHVVASPDAAIAALIGSLLGALAVPGSSRYLELVLALAVMCAAIFALFWYFRLGFLANYLSRAVLIGLVAGLGIEVLLSQVRKMMSVTVEAEGFFSELVATIQAIPEANLYSLGLGLGSIAIVRLAKRFAPKVPGALLALIVLTAVVALFDLTAYGVKVLGDIPAGLPRLHVPQAAVGEWISLVPGALAIVALTLSEGLLLARRYAQHYGYKIDPDQEEFAYGISNLAAGLTGGLVMGSSASRTAAMDDGGARTQWPSIVSAVIITLVLLFFTEQLAMLPTAVLAGIVANAVLKLIDIDEFRELYRLRRSEFFVAVVCTLSLLALGTLPGLTIAFLLTTIEVVRRAANPKTSILVERPDRQSYQPGTVAAYAFTAPGIVVYRFGGPLFFANGTVIQRDVETILSADDGTLEHFIFDAEAVNDIDTTGLEALENVIELLREQGIRFAISRAYPPVPELLAHYGLLDHIGAENIFETNRAAVAAAGQQRDTQARGDT